METLIELYDDRPLENVLGVETFQPGRVIYICPETVASDREIHDRLLRYFRHRGMKLALELRKAKVFNAESILRVLRKTVAQYPDCALDITGGTDAVLFAAGLLSADSSLPVFTYSRKRNSFFDIRNSHFGEELPCEVHYNVEDSFVMAGGSVRVGRVENEVLDKYLDLAEPFFRVFLNHRREWPRLVTYIQRISPPDKEDQVSLQVSGGYVVKGERGSRISAPEAALRELEQIGMLQELRIDQELGVSFSFPDLQIRSWLRDVGSVLELYIYMLCRRLELFDDIRMSLIVDWESEAGSSTVTNELDVVCTKGVIPLFISCKTCSVKTEALNELAVWRDRFGGQMAKAVIVTAERGSSPMRTRAAELGIAVIDLNDLTAGRVEARLQRMMKRI